MFGDRLDDWTTNPTSMEMRPLRREVLGNRRRISRVSLRNAALQEMRSGYELDVHAARRRI